MNKKNGMIIAGLGIGTAVGMTALYKGINSKKMSSYHGIKNEVADDIGHMAKKVGKTMVKVGKTMDKMIG